jgi:xylulose-5-phosphate/fructose-6-phosphate phosphoketolase
LNGWKIANPTVLARIPESELRQLLEGYGYTPYIIAGDDPMEMHQRMAALLELVLDEIEEIPRAGPVPRSWTGCRSREPGAPIRSRSTT